jgi:hypothetical protein
MTRVQILVTLAVVVVGLALLSLSGGFTDGLAAPKRFIP